MKNEFITYSDTKANDMKKWKTTINANLLHDQINSSFSQFFVNRRCVNILFCSKFAINQNASINKNSKNSNSKNLKQHTFAKSISFCCFCFCFVRKIDRFIILICKYFSHRSKSKFSTKFSFSWFYIFCFRFSFFDFAFIFWRLSHLFEFFCFCHD